MRAFIVRAWVNESDRELVRVDVEAIDTLKMGFGLYSPGCTRARSCRSSERR
jgi:hypothetical protein